MSMWEPRSSHLYVWTGLRVCEWFRVGAGHRVSVLVTDKWHRCAHQCVPRCVRVRPVRRSVPSSTCSCQCASKVCGLRDVCASVRPERTRAALTGGSCAQPRVGTRERALARLQLCTHRHMGEACEPAPAARPSVSRFAFVCSCRGDAPLGPGPQRSPALRGRAARCGFDQLPRQRRAAPAVGGRCEALLSRGSACPCRHPLTVSDRRTSLPL